MRIVVFCLLLSFVTSASSQNGPRIRKSVPDVKPLLSVKLSEVPEVWEASNESMPEPYGEYHKVKKGMDSLKQAHYRKYHKTTPQPYDEGNDRYRQTMDDILPDTQSNFLGLDRTAGVPNDNHMAISNDGLIVSVVNSWVSVLNEQGELLLVRSLTAIVRGALGRLDRTYDPKVLYDPGADRFILTFLQGTSSNDTRIIIGFSVSNDPTGDWNFYELEGNPFGGEYWSDYPIIAQNDEDFFVTINILRDNSSWQEGFTQSLIWQVSKEDGYNGVNLRNILWADIRYNNRAVWSICPVQPAEGDEQKDLFLLSVRPGDIQNDTLFIHHISNTVASGEAVYSLDFRKTPITYGVPPSALQPEDSFMLQTNDCRVLSGMVKHDRIQYVQTTAVPQSLRSGVFHGLIDDIYGSLSISANYIHDDSMDYGYPSIAFSGTDEYPQSSLITFSHSSENTYPGTSVIAFNRINKGLPLYSQVLRVKEGQGLINSFISDNTQERWGDYTQVQRRYNSDGEMWVCGSFGDQRNLNGTWITALKVSPEINALSISAMMSAFPVPATNSMTLRFDASEREQEIEINLFHSDGKLVKSFGTHRVRGINQEMHLNLSGINAGFYFIEVKFPTSRTPDRLVRKVIIE